MVPAPGSMIAVWFSCGAASAVAAKLTIERFRATHDVRIVNNPIANENADNRRFLADVEEWIGQPIEIAINEKFPNCDIREVFEKEKYMSGIHGAPCTRLLKKAARQQWELRNKPDWTVMGFTSDEKGRYDRFVLTERATTIPVLIDAGMSKDDCFVFVTKAGLSLPITYAQGWPTGNCPGCVKATSATYWNFNRVMRPDVHADRCEQSRRLGVKLVRYKGRRIYLDELPHDAVGRPMKSMKQIECGIFCEEPDKAARAAGE